MNKPYIWIIGGLIFGVLIGIFLMFYDYNSRGINIQGSAPLFAVAFTIIKLFVKDTRHKIILNGLVFLIVFLISIYIYIFTISI